MEYSPIVMVEFTESNTLAAGYFVQEIYDLMNELGYKWYRFENGQLQLEAKKDKYPYASNPNDQIDKHNINKQEERPQICNNKSDITAPSEPHIFLIFSLSATLIELSFAL